MAQIINKSNHLNKQKSKYTRRMWLWGILILFSLSLFPLSLPVSILFGYLFKKNSTEHSKIKSGITGEKSAIEVLENLSSEYTVINDLEIEFDGKKSQLDSVIVGPSGVFIMETKNVKGVIHGNDNDQYITVAKEGRKGGHYTTTMYNPVKQVGTHVYRLSNLLKQNGLNVWVKGIVFFSNPNTSIEMESEKIPVISYRNNKAVYLYISQYYGQPLPKDTQGKIIGLLKNYTMK